jgi:hypothetical protein
MEDLKTQNSDTYEHRMTQNVQDDQRSQAESEVSNEQLEQVTGGAVDAFIWFEPAGSAATDAKL